MERTRLGVIAGSGLYEPSLLDEVEEVSVGTPFGEITISVGRLNDLKVAFLARHGREHTTLPHQVNYRANLWGLKAAGVERIIALTAVGSLQESLPPGSLVAVDQFIDFTKQRPLTFYEEGAAKAHCDLSEPYCPTLRRHLVKTGVQKGITIKDGGCYVCTEGPRYETAAEVRMFRTLGGDVVGMTGVPEVVLARELGICYTNLSLVTNWAAGIGDQPLNHLEVVAVVKKHHSELNTIISAFLGTLDLEFACGCKAKEEF